MARVGGLRVCSCVSVTEQKQMKKPTATDETGEGLRVGGQTTVGGDHPEIAGQQDREEGGRPRSGPLSEVQNYLRSNGKFGGRAGSCSRCLKVDSSKSTEGGGVRGGAHSRIWEMRRRGGDYERPRQLV